MGPIEFSQPMTLTSPQGTIDFNGSTGDRWILIPEQCQAGPDLRVTKDLIPQSDGEIFHRRFKTGYTARLVAMPFKDGAYAIGADLVDMWDDLLLNLDALVNPSLASLGSGFCRLQWVQSGSGDAWMLDRIRLLELPRPSGIYPKVVAFTVDTELPYSMRTNETTTSLSDGVESTLNNTGTTAFQPVIKVYGDTAGVQEFTLVNTDNLDLNGNPVQIHWLGSALPGGADIGASDYIEINCFRGTVVLNGSESFASIAGIDIPGSDLRFPLVPGDNHITIDGADADILWQPARA